MQPTLSRRAVCALLLATPFWVPAHADTYPSKPITLIVPFSAGSGTDQLARGLAQAMQTALPGAVFVIDNKPGASGIIGAQAAARAPADGYTLLMTTNTTQAANPHLFKKLPYDPAVDFAPVATLARGSMVLTVPASSPLQSVADFIAFARTRSVSFGAGNSSSRVAAEMFKQATGANLLYVPYKSNPQAVTDLIGGQIDVMFADTATTLPLIQSGKLRALGYTGAKRTATLPSVPTLEEAGVKGYELSYWIAVYAPRGTPADIVRRLNEAITKSLSSDIMKTVFAQAILDSFAMTPEELGRFQQSEAEKWGRVIKAAGIEPE